MALPPFLASVVGWLRTGYPDGVPINDYVPLFALLASQLTDAEVRAVAHELIESAGDATSRQDVKDAIEMVTHAEPNDSDVARVRAHLAAGGWPLAGPSRPHA